MELFQRLTLYDLLGYALPGSVMIVISQWNGKEQQLQSDGEGTIVFWIVLVLLGYLMGIMISEVADGIKSIIWDENNWLKKICESYGISLRQVVSALRKAKILEEDISIAQFRELEKYIGRIYSVIQSTPQYSRIHNYASAALLYKNMALVSAFSCILGAIQGRGLEIVWGIIGTIVFAMRYYKFNKKRIGYTLCWFLDKYKN